jgi:hypothetical protein
MSVGRVVLKNGAIEGRGLVRGVVYALDKLRNDEGWEGCSALIELHDACRDSAYIMSEASRTTLISHNLLESSGHIREAIKNIVLSAVIEGEDLDIQLVDPVVRLASPNEE